MSAENKKFHSRYTLRHPFCRPLDCVARVAAPLPPKLRPSLQILWKYTYKAHVCINIDAVGSNVLDSLEECRW
jgi:hypothetical protein